jgi:phospholipase C
MYAERHLDKMRPITQFYVDAALGNLPNVFFVEPGLLGDNRTDDHPGGADINAGQAFVNNVVRAKTLSPQWSNSAFFINYDEWGGFFDHVVPPRVPDERASDDLDDDFGQLGFRLPAMAISPYSRVGYVHHDGPYEHTSILKFIERLHGLPCMSQRDCIASDMLRAFDFDQPPDFQQRKLILVPRKCDLSPDTRALYRALRKGLPPPE